MSSWREVVRVECHSCAAALTLSVVLAERREVLVAQAVNELLVDYGWLPTSWGKYCRSHAATVRPSRNGRSHW